VHTPTFMDDRHPEFYPSFGNRDWLTQEFCEFADLSLK
jgi:hypothetical protein